MLWAQNDVDFFCKESLNNSAWQPDISNWYGSARAYGEGHSTGPGVHLSVISFSCLFNYFIIFNFQKID